jgi:DNA-binding Lrp family transcriptional regulator
VVTAYILIQTEVGKAAQVAKDIVDIKGVHQAAAVAGPFDVIVRAEARNLDELGKLVVARVQVVDGITRRSPVRWCTSRAARPPSGVRPTATTTAARADRGARR